MTARAPFLDRLGVQLPIIQAPMAGVSTPAMAAAVSTCGGLGSLGLGGSSVDEARRMIEQFRKLHHGPLNVNLFCHAPGVADRDREAAWIARFEGTFAEFGAAAPAALTEPYESFIGNEAMLALLLELRPRVVSFHFGLPAPEVVARLKAAGTVLMASATSVAEARLVRDAGLDAVIAQGWEAGGHRGTFDPDAPDDRIGTVALVRLLVDAIDLPVVAAGGVMDGAGIAAMLRLGAAAAQLGTAYVLTNESAASESYRAALRSDAAFHTVMTRVISGRPARSLASEFTDTGSLIADGAVPGYPIAYHLGKALNAAALAAGRTGFGAYWAGQAAPLARATSAATLTTALAAEFNDAIGPAERGR
jgi:nitronate monooxygenase